MEQLRLNVEWVPIDRVHCSPANPRLNDHAVPHVAASLKRFGWQQPIVARPSGEVIAGNTRLKAAAELVMSDVPVVWFEGTDLEATAYAIADNKTGQFAEWDEPSLAKLLGELRAEDALDGVGFSVEEIDELIAQIEADIACPELDDPGPTEPPAEPITQRGDLWALGNHRLLCGDSRDAEETARLMGKERADLVWADPPYGVSYVGGTEDALEIENDGLRGDDLQDFLEGAFSTAREVCRDGAVWYVAAPAGPNFLPFAKVLTGLGVWRQTLVWVKDAFVLGHSDYHYKHEVLFYGWVEGAAHCKPPDRAQHTVWEFARPKVSREHPTMKPVELVVHALRVSSRPGDLVLDPFLGSGTTLLAAEQSGRRCYGEELDPRYCDVIVNRWQQATGETAILESTGQTFAETKDERLKS